MGAPFFAGLGKAISAFIASKGVIATLVKTILINVAIGKVSQLLSKRGARFGTPPINVTVRNPVENRRIVLGTQRVGGSLVFYGTSGDKNEILWYVVVYAGTQTSAIKDLWLDTQRVANSLINGGAAEGGAVTTGAFANKLWIFKHLGESSQGADTELDLAFSLWTPLHRLRGLAYCVIKMVRDDAKYPQGAPNSVTALLDGALMYDPRLDSTVAGGSGAHRKDNPSTWEFSRNPALHWRWYVSGGSVHNDQTTRLIRYGLRESDARIPDSFVIAAANKCDETISGANAPPSGSQPRYRCDLEVSTGETRRDILEDILMTMAGTHVVVQGQHRVYAGAYQAPSHAFTEADLYGALEVEDTVDHSRRYNQVAGVYRDASKEYVEQTTRFRTDAAYVTQDGGREIPIELDLRGVTDPYQAQRICEIKLRQSRMMRTVKLVGALNLLKVAQHETLTFSHARYGWATRVFQCRERQFDFNAEAGRVSLTCQRDDAGVWTDMLTADYITGTSDTDSFSSDTPDPPSSLTTNGRDSSILIEWGKPAIVYAGTSYELQESTSASMSSPTTVYQGPDLQALIKKTTLSNFYYRVRAVRAGGVSTWEPTGDGVLGKAASLVAALGGTVSPGAASSSSGSTSQTTNSVTVTATGGTSPYTYAWTWASGGSGITIDSATAATTSFSATSLTSGETRSGQARCTITDNVSATYTIDVSVTITRAAPFVGGATPYVFTTRISPTDAHASFRIDSDGHWYDGKTSTPSVDKGSWVTPNEYAGDYEVRVTRTGGSETAFTAGPALSTWHALTSDQTWRLSETGLGNRNIIFTLEIRRASDSVVVSTTTGNELNVNVEN